MQKTFALIFSAALASSLGAQATRVNPGPEQDQGKVPLPDWVLNPASGKSSTSLSPELQKKSDILRQLRTGDGPATPGDAPAHLQGRALADAKARVKNNDFAGAEDSLTVDNPFEPSTALWHLDTAQRWLTLAHDLSHEKDRSKLPAVVAQTLQHLDQAGSRAREKGDVHSQVTAKNSAAYLHERFRGDVGSAIASYRAALQLQPDDEPAREALDRLERSFANLQARARAGRR